jgi:hypothetical protein
LNNLDEIDDKEREADKEKFSIYSKVGSDEDESDVS